MVGKSDIPTAARKDRESLPDGLSPAEAETLRHMVRAGTPAGTLRATGIDLAYLQAWSEAVFGEGLSWPASETVIARFLAHHLFNAGARALDPSHGMPLPVEKALRERGFLAGRMPPALSTIERRLATWSKLHALKGLESPLRLPRIRQLKRSLVAGFDGARKRKSAEPVTLREVTLMLRSCSDENDPKDLRDRALIATMYATGGRRRSEIGRIRVRDISFSNVPADPARPLGEQMRAMRITLPKTKTTRAGEAEVWAVGFAAEAMQAWLRYLGHIPGTGEACAFPRIFSRKVRNELGFLSTRCDVDAFGPGLSGEGVRLVIRERLRLSGLDSDLYSPHGIRAGFLTDAQRSGVTLAEAMKLSLHRSEKQALRYYAESAVTGRAARMLATLPTSSEA